MHKWIDDEYLTPLFETNSDYTEWFGYYNYDVISRDGTKMLCNRATFDGRSITADDKIDLGWYDIISGEWNYIDTTNSFNWQQGAMLQWMPGPENENKVIYNIAENNHFRSVIFDVLNGNKKYIDFPTYCVTPDGRYSISLDYERSYWCRAYHYQSVVNNDYDVNIAEDDGIFRVDLQTNSFERIVRIQDVISIDSLDDFDKAKHWLEHIMINPSGTRIVFLHRFTYVKGYTTRVCFCNIDGSNLEVLSDWQNNFWSHIGWNGDDAFAIYTVKRPSITPQMKQVISEQTKQVSFKSWVKKTIRKMAPECLKRIIRTPQDSYYQVYKFKMGKFRLSEIYKDNLLNIDGHPSFALNGQFMVTDSYPDEKGNQRLLIYNTKTNKIIKIGSFYATFNGNPASCDLHPKLSYGGKILVVDTAYSGKHKMSAYSINWEKIIKDTN